MGKLLKNILQSIQLDQVNCKMINAEKNSTESIPVFVPPRRRGQTSKKQNGTQNYVDHIVCVQVCNWQIFY